MKEKLRSVLNDSLWSIAGLVLMNVIAQFLVYPFWSRTFGSEKYGEIIFLLSLMNIVSISLGSACNYARITLKLKGETRNIDYLVLLGLSTAAAAVFAFAVSLCSGSAAADAVCYILLCGLTLWRFYADIEYRMHLNYKGYFLYYLAIGMGYILGTVLMRATELWALALVPGELLGILLVRVKGSVLRKDGRFSREQLREPFRLFLVLAGSYLIDNLIFNSDRILIKLAVGSTAMSVYYISSLLGKTLALVTVPFSSVISGYLARFKGTLSTNAMHAIAAVSLACAFLAAGVCTLGSYILIPVLYPEDFETAKEAFFLCNLSQTLYFVSNIVSVVLLRFSKSRFQVYLNAVYAGVFAVVCVPLTILYQMDGFYTGLIVTAVSRLLFGIGVGYYTVFSTQKKQ